MPYPNILVQSMAAAGGGAGRLVSLPLPAKQIRIDCGTGGEAWVRTALHPRMGADIVTPVQPAATPAPAAGTASQQGWVHLKAGDTYRSPIQRSGDYYREVEIWEVAAGDLTINGEEE